LRVERDGLEGVVSVDARRSSPSGRKRRQKRVFFSRERARQRKGRYGRVVSLSLSLFLFPVFPFFRKSSPSPHLGGLQRVAVVEAEAEARSVYFEGEGGGKVLWCVRERERSGRGRRKLRSRFKPMPNLFLLPRLSLPSYRKTSFS
jgi:hypothetical protein